MARTKPYRLQRDVFDGSTEFGSPPTQPSGCDILKELNGISFNYGKTSKSSNKRVREDRGNLTPYAFQEHAIDNPNSSARVPLMRMLMMILFKMMLMGSKYYGRKEVSSLICLIGNIIFLDTISM